MALESWNYDHSTQNRKLHQAVVTVWFRKKSPLTVCFHFTNTDFCRFLWKITLTKEPREFLPTAWELKYRELLFELFDRIINATGDNPSSLAGLRLDVGDLALSLGTSDTLMMAMKQANPQIQGIQRIISSWNFQLNNIGSILNFWWSSSLIGYYEKNVYVFFEIRKFRKILIPKKWTFFRSTD